MKNSRFSRMLYCQMCGKEGTEAALWERVYLGEVIGHVRVCWGCYDALRACQDAAAWRAAIKRARDRQPRWSES